MQSLRDRKQFRESDDDFERWISQKIIQRKNKQGRTQAGPYQIPVVVHVIHKGEAVGVGSNIPDAQIISQITVLNEDYNRHNADASSTPSVFQSVAGSIDVQFVLAKQDPEGLPTNGIVRVRGSKDGWVSADNYELKAQSYWPAEDYLNIWVCDLTDDLIGYAQLPESGLAGLEGSSKNAETDGVVIWYRAFGSIAHGSFDLNSNFNRGRTATHEIGHYFGLRHIWGDDSGACTGTDYVDDTPNQAGNSTGCPTHPKTTCSVVNMFQNYMDYTNDNCMNLFTAGQVARMQTVIENSPRRVSLLTSKGLTTPTQFAVDAGIKALTNLPDFLCNAQVAPSITVRNYGTSTLNNVQITFKVDGNTIETKNFPVSLTNLQETNVTFSSANISTGNHTLTFSVTGANGGTDQYSGNNVFTQNIIVPQTITAPFTETFTTLPATWTVVNPDGLNTWELVTAPRESASNKAMYLDIYDYEESQGEIDYLLSPLIDLSTAPAASLEFYVSHARYPNSNDKLRVVVIQDCEDISQGTIVYEKSSAELTTTTQTSSTAFTPGSASQWRREFVDLSPFIGPSKIQLAFVVISDWGNNIYLDNVGVLTSQFEDVALTSLESPAVVTCNASPSPVLRITNVGTKQVISVKVQYSINGAAKQTVQFTGLTLSRGDEALLQMPQLNLPSGSNALAVTVIEPNGVEDPTPVNNAGTYHITVNDETDVIPLRENFEDDFSERWVTANLNGGANWETVSTNFGKSISFQSFGNTVIGDQAWLVSPVLDFRHATAASLVFDISQRGRADQQDPLQVFASTDCGDTFHQVYEVDINPSNVQSSWTPDNDNDWQQNVTVDLSDLAGQQNIRIAFVATNQNANNIYVDNIEFFTANPPNLIAVSNYFSIYGYKDEDPAHSNLQITFNLEHRQDVQFTIVDLMGRTYADGTLTDVLNQSYPIDLDERARGIYIVRVRIDGKFYTQKILVHG